MKALHFSCQGESHKATDKVCQDFSFSEVSDHLAIAIVCDGHGGKRYFRSDVGAKYATEITKQCVTTFINDVDKKLFRGAPLSQVQALNTEVKNDNFAKKNRVDVAMRQLFASIIYRWQEMIRYHAYNYPLTDAELASIDPRYVADFEEKNSLEKTYGCTLMCYAITDDYWFAFHLGDGKCIAFQDDGSWGEPIPWDERCFLNRTTSLCDTDALDEFRYCYQGEGNHPVAVFLGSDGIDDSFGETTNMVNFYAQVVKLLAQDPQGADSEIRDTLPVLSARGSQDDMSVACVYDEALLPDAARAITRWQRDNVMQAIDALNKRISQLLDKYNRYWGKSLSQSQQIDYQYTVTELRRAYQNKRDQVKRYNRFSRELDPASVPYTDAIGLGEQYFLLPPEGKNKKLFRHTPRHVPKRRPKKGLSVKLRIKN